MNLSLCECQIVASTATISSEFIEPKKNQSGFNASRKHTKQLIDKCCDSVTFVVEPEVVRCDMTVGRQELVRAQKTPNTNDITVNVKKKQARTVSES
jgi:hypothetical protein